MSQIFDRLRRLSAKVASQGEKQTSSPGPSGPGKPVNKTRTASKKRVLLLSLGILTALSALAYTFWWKQSQSSARLGRTAPAQEKAQEREPATIAPNSMELNRQAVAKAQGGDLAQATSLIAQALEQDPDKPLFLFNQALILEASGANQEALESLRTLTASSTKEDSSELLRLARERLWYLEKAMHLNSSEAQP